MSRPLTRKRQKIMHAMGHSTKGKNGYQLITYCPVCNADVLNKKAKNEEFVGVKISAGTRKAHCKNNHTWAVV